VLVDSEDTRGSDWAALAVACAAYVVSYYFAMQPGLPLDGVLPFSFWFAFLVLFSRRSALSRGRVWCPAPRPLLLAAAFALLLVWSPWVSVAEASATRLPVDAALALAFLSTALRMLCCSLAYWVVLSAFCGLSVRGAVWPRVVGASMAAAALLFALFLLVPIGGGQDGLRLGGILAGYVVTFAAYAVTFRLANVWSFGEGA
jgi:hypothetical protein